jgi:hypothetical protein
VLCKNQSHLRSLYLPSCLRINSRARSCGVEVFTLGINKRKIFSYAIEKEYFTDNFKLSLFNLQRQSPVKNSYIYGHFLKNFGWNVKQTF